MRRTCSRLRPVGRKQEAIRANAGRRLLPDGRQQFQPESNMSNSARFDCPANGTIDIDGPARGSGILLVSSKRARRIGNIDDSTWLRSDCGKIVGRCAMCPQLFLRSAFLRPTRRWGPALAVTARAVTIQEYDRWDTDARKWAPGSPTSRLSDAATWSSIQISCMGGKHCPL